MGYPDDLDQMTPATPYKLISAADTNATSVVAVPAVLTGYYLSNTGAGFAYVKLYDKASAPTVGTNTPKWTLAIPGGAAANIEFLHPLQFAVGLAFAITGGAPDSDTTAVAANQVIVNLAYI